MLQQVIHGTIQIDPQKKTYPICFDFSLALIMTTPWWKYNNTKFFVQLNVLNNPMKHWFDRASWETVNCICEQFLKITQSVIVRNGFVFLSANEMTTIDN